MCVEWVDAEITGDWRQELACSMVEGWRRKLSLLIEKASIHTFYLFYVILNYSNLKVLKIASFVKKLENIII